MVEEDVHELPQHVVERLDQLLADRRVGAGGSNSHSAPAGANASVRQPRSRASASAAARLAAVLVGPERDRDVVGLRHERRPASARLAALAGQADAPAARACRRSPGARTRPRRGGRPSARPASGRTRPAGRRARSARPSGGRARASRSASASKKSRFARVRSASARSTTSVPSACVTRAPPRGDPTRASQSRHSSIPSPVFALTSIRSHARVHRVEVVEEPVEVEVEVRQQVDLVDQHQLAGAEHQRVLERLLLALGDRGDHDPRVLADPELGRADEVADVLDHQQVDVVERQLAGSAERTMFASRWHSPPKPGVGVELRDRHVQRGQPVGVHRALHVALEHADAHARAGRPPRARAAPSCRRPGALMKFTTRTPARSKSARFAWAIVLLASSASSTTLTFVRCIRPPRPRSTRPRTRRRARPRPARRPARRAHEHRQLDLPLALAVRAAQPRRDQLLLEPRALADRALRDEAEVELERVGHHLAQRADAHAHDAHRPSRRVLLDGVHDRAGERQLVHRLSPPRTRRRPGARRSSRRRGRRRRPPRAPPPSLSPSPISSTPAGSQATTTTLPGQAPSVFTKRSTVCGSIPCGLITWPSSMPASTSSSERLHHVQRPGLAALAAHVDEHAARRSRASPRRRGRARRCRSRARPRPRAARARSSRFDDLAAEAVVAQPGVADAGDQDPLHSTTSTSGGKNHRKRPVSRSTSWPGSSTLTPRCTRPS